MLEEGTAQLRRSPEVLVARHGSEMAALRAEAQSALESKDETLRNLAGEMLREARLQLETAKEELEDQHEQLQQKDEQLQGQQEQLQQQDEQLQQQEEARLEIELRTNCNLVTRSVRHRQLREACVAFGLWRSAVHALTAESTTAAALCGVASPLGLVLCELEASLETGLVEMALGAGAMRAAETAGQVELATTARLVGALQLDASGLLALAHAWVGGEDGRLGAASGHEADCTRRAERAEAEAAAAEEAAAEEESAAEEEAVVAAAAVAVAAAPKRKVSFGAEMSPAKVVVGWQGGGDDCSEAEEEESIYSEEESGSEAAEDEWRAQGGGGGRGGGCFGGDFGDDAATLARAAQWRRENPDLAVRQAEFFHSLWDDPGGAVAKEELLALGLSPDYRHECGICDRDYMLRRGCPCCRD